MNKRKRDKLRVIKMVCLGIPSSDIKRLCPSAKSDDLKEARRVSASISYDMENLIKR